MEKKLTNSGSFMESTSKHSIYPLLPHHAQTGADQYIEIAQVEAAATAAEDFWRARHLQARNSFVTLQHLDSYH